MKDGTADPEPLPLRNASNKAALEAGAEEALNTAALSEEDTPLLAGEYRWYSEHTALLVSTLKWALLGTAAGICVGLGTKAFLWVLAWATGAALHLNRGWFRYYDLLPLALPLCVWLVRTFAPTAKGHGTEAVITAVHTRSGKVKPGRRAGQAARDRPHAGVRRIRRQGRAVCPDRRVHHQRLCRSAPPARRGPAASGDLRHRGRVRRGPSARPSPGRCFGIEVLYLGRNRIPGPVSRA